MSELVRLYRYKSLLSGRRAVSSQELMTALEISPATFKRDLAKLRDQLHVPIKFNRELGGYTLHYRVVGEVIDILAVAHQKRRSGYWRKR